MANRCRNAVLIQFGLQLLPLLCCQICHHCHMSDSKLHPLQASQHHSVGWLATSSRTLPAFDCVLGCQLRRAHSRSNSFLRTDTHGTPFLATHALQHITGISHDMTAG